MVVSRESQRLTAILKQVETVVLDFRLMIEVNNFEISYRTVSRQVCYAL